MILDILKVGDVCPFPNISKAGKGAGGMTSSGAGAATHETHSGKGYVFLPFVPNGINFVIASGVDVVSYPFSGCYMASYNDEKDLRCVCHVSTGTVGDCTAAWDAYRKGKTVHLQFKPWSLWNDDKKIDFKFTEAAEGFGVYGVMTGADEGYGVLVHPATRKILDIRKHGTKAPWRVFTKVFVL